jgi:hypothetical protein
MFITETTHNNLGYIYLVYIMESTCLLQRLHIIFSVDNKKSGANIVKIDTDL